MSQMTGKRRTLSAIGSLVALVGCLEPIEPTPNSAPLSITPMLEATSVIKGTDGFTFSLPLMVKNVGTSTVYVDLYYRRTEKLVDQKWEVAAESVPTSILRSFAPNESRRIEYIVVYKPGEAYPLLEQARGVYRVGLRAFYGNTATDPISPSPLYSKSFVLIEAKD